MTMRRTSWDRSLANPAADAQREGASGGVSMLAAAASRLYDPASASLQGPFASYDYPAASTPHAHIAWTPPNLSIFNFRLSGNKVHSRVMACQPYLCR